MTQGLILHLSRQLESGTLSRRRDAHRPRCRLWSRRRSAPSLPRRPRRIAAHSRCLGLAHGSLWKWKGMCRLLALAQHPCSRIIFFLTFPRLCHSLLDGTRLDLDAVCHLVRVDRLSPSWEVGAQYNPGRTDILLNLTARMRCRLLPIGLELPSTSSSLTNVSLVLCLSISGIVVANPAFWRATCLSRNLPCSRTWASLSTFSMSKLKAPIGEMIYLTLRSA